jgi:hypothetical protein
MGNWKLRRCPVFQNVAVQMRSFGNLVHRPGFTSLVSHVSHRRAHQACVKSLPYVKSTSHGAPDKAIKWTGNSHLVVLCPPRVAVEVRHGGRFAPRIPVGRSVSPFFVFLARSGSSFFRKLLVAKTA